MVAERFTITNPFEFVHLYSDLLYGLRFHGVITEEVYFFLRDIDPHDLVGPEQYIMNEDHAIGIILSYARNSHQEWHK